MGLSVIWDLLRIFLLVFTFGLHVLLLLPISTNGLPTSPNVVTTLDEMDRFVTEDQQQDSSLHVSAYQNEQVEYFKTLEVEEKKEEEEETELDDTLVEKWRQQHSLNQEEESSSFLQDGLDNKFLSYLRSNKNCGRRKMFSSRLLSCVTTRKGIIGIG